MIGLGPAKYFDDGFNTFDCVVVMSSLMEIVVDLFHISLGVNTSLLRALRLLRILKLIKSWDALRRILEMILRSVIAVSNLCLLMILIMFVFTLLAMQLLGNQFTDEKGFDLAHGAPRGNYDTFGWAILHVFFVMTGKF